MAADKGNSDAMYNYATMLSDGEGIERNSSEAIKYYKMAVDKGNLKAMYKYATMHIKDVNLLKVNSTECISKS